MGYINKIEAEDIDVIKTLIKNKGWCSHPDHMITCLRGINSCPIHSICPGYSPGCTDNIFKTVLNYVKERNLLTDDELFELLL